MTRVVIYPGYSNTSTAVLSSVSENSLIILKVSSEVFNPRTISTRGILGTGFKKCIPITLSGRCVTSAISVILRADVFVTKIVSLSHISSIFLKRFCFATRFSVIASITRSPYTELSISLVTVVRERIAFFSDSVIVHRSISASILSSSFSFPVFTPSWSRSIRITSMPLDEISCDMPRPIIPAPITTTFLIVCSLSSNSRVPLLRISIFITLPSAGMKYS